MLFFALVTWLYNTYVPHELYQREAQKVAGQTDVLEPRGDIKACGLILIRNQPINQPSPCGHGYWQDN